MTRWTRCASCLLDIDHEADTYTVIVKERKIIKKSVERNLCLSCFNKFKNSTFDLFNRGLDDVLKLEKLKKFIYQYYEEHSSPCSRRDLLASKILNGNMEMYDSFLNILIKNKDILSMCKRDIPREVIVYFPLKMNGLLIIKD